MNLSSNHDFLSITANNPKSQLVLLHGYGSDADDLLTLGKQINEICDDSLNIISLRAPNITANGVGREWYQLYPNDWKQAKEEVKILKKRIIDISKNQLDLHKTFLLGFSQGGAMALGSGIELPLAGIISCSGYPHPDLTPKVNNSPIFLSHGKFDNVVPLNAFIKLKKILINYEVREFLFDGSHEINFEVILKITEFIKLNQ